MTSSKQAAAKVLARWKRGNESPDAQKRLVADQWRLWRLARDLADALESVLASGERERSGS